MKPVKTTRTITVSGIVLTSKDLLRIAAIFQQSAAESGDRSSTEYQVKFEDETTIASDSPELFTDESLVSPSRPIRIRMSFHDYSSGREIVLSLEHGNSKEANSIRITGQEEAWLREKFTALKDAIGNVRPQNTWFIKHPVISLFLVVTPLGALLSYFVELPVSRFFESAGFPYPSWLHNWPSAVVAILTYEWLKNAWPSVEFDFGSDHLRAARNRRKRLLLLATLVIVPVARSVIVDKWFK